MDCSFGPRGVAALCTFLEHEGASRNLKSFGIVRNPLVTKGGGIIYITEALSTRAFINSTVRSSAKQSVSPCALQMLTFNGVALDAHGLEVLCLVAVDLPSLRLISVGSNSLGRQAGVIVARSVGKKLTVRFLLIFIMTPHYLSALHWCQHLSPIAITFFLLLLLLLLQALCSLIHSFRVRFPLFLKLPGISLNDNNLDDHGAAAIGGALCAFSESEGLGKGLRLELLDLSKNNIKAEGFSALFKGLRAASSISSSSPSPSSSRTTNL